MAEKVRPGFMSPPVATTAAISPNPAASGLSWPMSFPSAPASYERSGMPSLKAMNTQGTRYDPIRHTQYNPAEPRDGYAAEDGRGDGAQKRKRDDADQTAAVAVEDTSMTSTGTGAYSYEPQKIVTPTNSLQSGKRNHVCDICGATFTRQHNLKSHFLTHTSSKKEFICSECGSEFRRSHDLKRHQKLHSGEKPFACNTCGRRFARADALGRHTKSSGEGGCVNSRKTSSDPGSVSHAGNAFEAGSPPYHGEPPHADHHFHRSGLDPIEVSNEQANAQASPSDPYAPTQDPSYNAGRGNPSGGSHDYHTLPPLQTAFGFDKDRAYQPPVPVPVPLSGGPGQESYLSTPRFGISPTFDTSRPASTHPLSFDRGSAAEGSASSSATTQHSLAQAQFTMVPLQRYQQLEAEHREAIERIKRFESTKPDAGDARPPDRSSTT